VGPQVCVCVMCAHICCLPYVCRTAILIVLYRNVPRASGIIVRSVKSNMTERREWGDSDAPVVRCGMLAMT